MNIEMTVQDKIFFALVLIVGIPSLIGSLMIMAGFYRLLDKSHLPQQLLLILSIGNALFAIAYFLDMHPTTMNFACGFQAWLKQASSQCTFIVSFWISYGIYKSIIQNKAMTPKQSRNVLISCFVPPILTATLPTTYGGYSNIKFQCSFNLEGYKFIFSLVLFFGPFIVLSITSITLLAKVRKFLKKLAAPIIVSDHMINNLSSLRLQGSQVEFGHKVSQYLQYYPLVQVACWTPFAIYEIAEFSKAGSYLYGLNAARYIFCLGQGLADAVIYWLSNRVKTSSVDVLSSMSLQQDQGADEEEYYYRGTLTSSHLKL